MNLEWLAFVAPPIIVFGYVAAVYADQKLASRRRRMLRERMKQAEKDMMDEIEASCGLPPGGGPWGGPWGTGEVEWEKTLGVKRKPPSQVPWWKIGG